MNRRVIMGSLLLVLLAASVISATLVMAHSELGREQDVDAHVNQVPSSAQEIPGLTEAQETEMRAIISADPILTRILRDGHEVNEMGPWVAGDLTFIGGIAEVLLTNPASFNGSLPLVAFEPSSDEQSEYQSGTESFIASGIESLYVLVDLEAERVVGIEIGQASSVTTPTGQ